MVLLLFKTTEDEAGDAAEAEEEEGVAEALDLILIT